MHIDKKLLENTNGCITLIWFYSKTILDSIILAPVNHQLPLIKHLFSYLIKAIINPTIFGAMLVGWTYINDSPGNILLFILYSKKAIDVYFELSATIPN